MVDNRVLMRIFGSKWDEERAEWRKLHNEELNDLQAYPLPLGKTKLRWEDNIKMDNQGVGIGGMDQIDLAQDRDIWQALANAVTNLRVP